MQQTEIETAFAELLENIMGIHQAQMSCDLHLEKLGLDSLSKIDLRRGRRPLRHPHTR
jgi:acyl carrier protein